jgi:hypothetical protein
MKLIKKREPMLVGEIIAQAVMEGRLLKSLTKDVKDYGQN